MAPETEQSIGGLQDMTIYYQLIKVWNNAGNYALRVSNGFRIDVSPPTCGLVFDGPSFDRRYVGPTIARAIYTLDNVTEMETDSQGIMETDQDLAVTGDLQVSWIKFRDWPSGIGGYAAAIVSSELLGKANTSNTRFLPMGFAGSTSMFVRLVHNTMYHGVVSTWDRLGNERKCYSNGVLFDVSAPRAIS